MVGRHPARYLAPVALVAAAIGTYLIVEHHLGGGGPAVVASEPSARAESQARHARATFYTVKAGDNLTRISIKTGVSIPALERLNRSLANPDSLQPGQRIRLRR